MLKIKTADPFVSGCLSTERKRLSLFTSHDRDHLQDKYSQLKDLHSGQISPHSSVSGCGSCIIYLDESISCLSPVSLQFLSSESSDISCPPKKKKLRKQLPFMFVVFIYERQVMWTLSVDTEGCPVVQLFC